MRLAFCSLRRRRGEENTSSHRADLRELLPQPGAHLGGHERVGIRQRRGLILDRLDDARIAVADVDAHQLAVEVDEALALGRPEIDAVRLRDRDRIDMRLRRPLIERVLLRQRHHFLPGHCLIKFGVMSVANSKIASANTSYADVSRRCSIHQAAPSQARRGVGHTVRHAGDARDVL